MSRAKDPRKPKPGGKGSTKPRFDEVKQRAYLEKLRVDRLGRLNAAKEVGVDPTTVRRRIAADSDFANAVSEAEMIAESEKTEEVEDSLFQAATGGNVTACQVWLYNRAPTRWRDKRNPYGDGLAPLAAATAKDGTVSFYVPQNGREAQ